MPGQLFDGEDLFAHGVGREFGGVGQIFDEQSQIVNQVEAANLAGCGESRLFLAREMFENLAGLIVLLDVDAGDEPLGGVDARQELLARRGGVIVAQLAHPGIAIINVHGPPLLSTPPLNGASRGVPCDSFAHGSGYSV